MVQRPASLFNIQDKMAKMVHPENRVPSARQVSGEDRVRRVTRERRQKEKYVRDLPVILDHPDQSVLEDFQDCRVGMDSLDHRETVDGMDLQESQESQAILDRKDRWEHSDHLVSINHD